MMKFLGFLVVLAVIVLGVGYYLNWFQFSKASQGDKTDYSLTVDQKKIKEDTAKGVEKVKGIGSNAKEALPGKSESKEK